MGQEHARGAYAEISVLPVMRPLLPTTDKIVPYLREIERTRQYTNFGPLVEQLERRLAAHLEVGPENVVAVTNGTLALSAAVATSTLDGAEWRVPSWTFAATAQSVISVGRQPRIVDVEEGTWMLNPESSDAVDGVIVVCPFGQFQYLDEWRKVARDTPVILDAASCFDSCENLTQLVNDGLCTMISMHATKLVSSGEGGVLIGPEAWITEVRKWINFGFHGSRIPAIPGQNAKMSEYQAAIGLASLDEWREVRSEWEEVIRSVRSLVSEAGFKVQRGLSEGKVTSTAIVVFDHPSQKANCQQVFAESGVESRDWWSSGLHSMEVFSLYTPEKETFEVTDNIASTTLGVPLWRGMSFGEFQRISDCLEMLA